MKTRWVPYVCSGCGKIVKVEEWIDIETGDSYPTDRPGGDTYCRCGSALEPLKTG